MAIAIVILFLSQLVTFTLVFILYSRLQKNKHLYEQQLELMEQNEHSMQLFLLDMQEENDRFIQEMKAQSTEAPHSPSTPKKVHTSAEKKTQPFQQSSSQPIQPPIIDTISKSYTRVSDEPIDLNEIILQPSPKPVQPKKRSLQEEVVMRQQAGQSIAQIAKELNKGMTEIELMLKFKR